MTSADTLDLLRNRRSPKLRTLAAPGPTRSQLADLLTIAARVPDHGKLVPWRLVVVEGAAGDELGRVAAAALARTGADTAKVDEIRTRFTAIPVTVVVICCTRTHPTIPVFEQQLSAGAVCMNYLIAARASGFGAVWLTEWVAADADVRQALGVGETERIAGFLYTGTEPGPREDRPRPDLAQIVTYLGR